MAEEIRTANASRNKRPRAAVVVPLNSTSSSSEKQKEMNGLRGTAKSPSLENNDDASVPSVQVVRRNYHSSEWDKPVTKDEFDIARARHDMFTLLIMVPIITFSILDFDVRVFTELSDQTWTGGSFFWHLWFWTLAYDVLDMIWMILVPHCVRTPKTLVRHHSWVLVYLFGGLPWPHTRKLIGPLMLVEINSFFAVARRVFWKRRMPAAGNFFHNLFMSTWIPTRNVLYPAILVVLIRNCRQHVCYLLLVPLHFYFCMANFTWTQQLWTPILRDCYRYVQCYLAERRRRESPVTD